ncbi:uncharacterized protein LOC135079169 [Ostrinia nubilalis]|uniref:uncharacterized protein LOC135079169 n=1 Tax=Ostrinia nubilalis TaxID=29057 RepID=UPI00308250E5
MEILVKLALIAIALVQVESELNATSNVDKKSVVLSRRKRFLVFPEGSSVQLVFCNTFPNISPQGDIVLWGYTAALAYELPQDPYSPFNHKADPLHRRADSKAIYYTDEDGKVIYKRPYQRKFIVNPAFAKRSVDGVLPSPQFKKGTREKFKIDRKQMHASKNKRQFLKSECMEAGNVEFHRSNRGTLYQKIEAALRGLGANGKECLLRTICLVGQAQHHPQGEFLQEIMRAVFTIPSSKSASGDDYKEYDEAFSQTKPCAEVYPDCEETVEENIPSLSF